MSSLSSSLLLEAAEPGLPRHSWNPDLDTPSHSHICLMVGAVVAVSAAAAAYSASINSYLSLTDAPLQSTPLLLSGKRTSSQARGSSARVRGAGRAREA